MRYSFLFISIAVLVACKNKEGDFALRDSITTKYIAMLDTSGQYDTSELNTKILKAYISNDTAFFRQLDKQITQNYNDRPAWDLWNKDIPLPKLQDLHVEQAYRFTYSLLGGSAYRTVTITKEGDSIKLHYLRFFYEFGSVIPKVDTQYTKELSGKEWDELVKKLHYADFWHLKKEGSRRGTDGSDLTVMGYIRGNPADGNPDKYNFVHRFWMSTLDDAMFYVYLDLLKEDRLW